MRYLFCVPGELVAGATLTLQETDDVDVALGEGTILVATAHTNGGYMDDEPADDEEKFAAAAELRSWSPFIKLTMKDCGAGVLVNREHVSVVATADGESTRVFILDYGPLEVSETPDEVEKMLGLGEEEADADAAEDIAASGQE